MEANLNLNLVRGLLHRSSCYYTIVIVLLFVRSATKIGPYYRISVTPTRQFGIIPPPPSRVDCDVSSDKQDLDVSPASGSLFYSLY